jgi:hypothetical protein
VQDSLRLASPWEEKLHCLFVFIQIRSGNSVPKLGRCRSHCRTNKSVQVRRALQARGGDGRNPSFSDNSAKWPLKERMFLQYAGFARDGKDERNGSNGGSWMYNR